MTSRSDPKTISRWFLQGWSMFRDNRTVSLLYTGLFMLFGLLAQILLLSAGYGLVYFILVGGFIIIAPAAALLFYRPAIMGYLENRGVTATGPIPSSAIAIGIITFALYLIWVTDALIVYAVYFGFDPVYPSAYLSDPVIASNTHEFLFFAGVLGAVMAFITYLLTAFSIPHAIFRNAGFVDAVMFNTKTIFAQFRLLFVWALILGAVQLITLLLVIPLSLLVIPVLSYANLQAYLDLVPDSAHPQRQAS